jgi:hypothetical protein
VKKKPRSSSSSPSSHERKKDLAKTFRGFPNPNLCEVLRVLLLQFFWGLIFILFYFLIFSLSGGGEFAGFESAFVKGK